MASVTIQVRMDERNFRSMRREYDQAAMDEAKIRVLLLDLGDDTYRLAGPKAVIPHPQPGRPA